jgi:hypothetical protein
MTISCCVVGFSTRKDRCPALTFFRVKREDAEWQAAIVKVINRANKGFNIDNFYVCSCDFNNVQRPLYDS